MEVIAHDMKTNIKFINYVSNGGGASAATEILTIIMIKRSFTDMK